jgi:hypothetical protein
MAADEIHWNANIWSKRGGKETVRIETIILNIEVQKKVFT